MRSAVFRVMIGATAWIALGVAAFFIYGSEQRIAQLAASLRAFDQHAREATTALTEARVSQQAYVAEGQGIGFWMPKVTSSMESAQASLAALRASGSAAAQTALEQAAATTTEFTSIEQRVRDYLKSGQGLMAGDVIFTEGSETAANAGRQIEAARQAERQAFDVEEAGIRKLEAMIGAGAAAVVGLIVLLLLPARRTAANDAAESPLSIAPTGTIAAAPAAPPHATTFKAAASLATDFGRVRDLDELTRTLGRAADAMDASGVMVWMGSTRGGDLRPVMAHGYAADVLARIPPVPRSADNAAAAAYRSGTLQIVLSRPGKSSGAIVAPILSPEGCVGALSAEIRHGAETSEAVQAVAEIAAAHLAGVLATTPADIGEAKAAQA
jgi:hypothetical protein